MSNFTISLIRTWVPILVGSAVSWFASLGLHVDDQTKGSLVVGATGLLIGLYYTAVRLLEQRFPKLSFLLGTGQQPDYTPAPPAPVAQVAQIAPPAPAPAPLVTPPAE